MLLDILSFLLFKQTQAKQERRETLTRSNIAFATGWFAVNIVFHLKNKMLYVAPF